LFFYLSPLAEANGNLAEANGNLTEAKAIYPEEISGHLFKLLRDHKSGIMSHGDPSGINSCFFSGPATIQVFHE